MGWCCLLIPTLRILQYVCKDASILNCISKSTKHSPAKIHMSLPLKFYLYIFLGSVSQPVSPGKDCFPFLTKVTFKVPVEMFECVLGLDCQSIFLGPQIIPFSLSCTIPSAQNELNFEVQTPKLTLIFCMGLVS